MFIVVSFVRSTKKAIVAEASLRCGDFLFENNCRHSTGSFSFFLVLTARHYLSFTNLKDSGAFLGLVMPL